MPNLLRRRWVQIAAATFVVLVAAWLAICIDVVGHPRVDGPTKADAIVILGEPENGSIAAMRSLVRKGISDQVVISVPFGRPTECSQPPAGVQIYCFIPEPSTTRGEAEMIKKLAAQRHWTHIVVITWPSHISRSRMLINRCFSGELQMVEYRQDRSVLSWLHEFAYQSAAYVKTQLRRSC